MLYLILSLSLLTTQNCSTHQVKRVSATGRVLVMEDGTAWLTHVNSGPMVSLWLPGDEVLLCGKRLTNKATDQRTTIDFITVVDKEEPSIIEPIRKQKVVEKSKASKATKLKKAKAKKSKRKEAQQEEKEE